MFTLSLFIAFCFVVNPKLVVFCSTLRRLLKESKILESVFENEPSKLFEICALQMATSPNLRVHALRSFLVLVTMNQVFR